HGDLDPRPGAALPGGRGGARRPAPGARPGRRERGRTRGGQLSATVSKDVAVNRTRQSISSPTAGTDAPAGRKSIEACMCGGSANSRCLPPTGYGERTNPAAYRPTRAIELARALRVASPVGASRPMPWEVPPETTRIVPARGAVRPR